MVFSGRSASIRSRRETTPVSGLTCLRKRATVPARRNAPVTAAGHHQLAAGGKLDRRRRTARVAQFLAAAGRALRAGRDVMLDDGRAQQVEADDVIAQFGAEVGGDRLGDLDGGELDGALAERLPGERRSRDAAGVAAVEECLDLAVAGHAVGETGPARALARREYRAPPAEKCRRVGPAASANDPTNASGSIRAAALRDNRSPK